MSGSDGRRPASGPAAGHGIRKAAWYGTALFAVTATAAVLVEALDPVALVVDVVLFVAGLVLFVAAYARAVTRSRTESIAVTTLYFLAGSAPPDVRRSLLGALSAQVVVAVAGRGRDRARLERRARTAGAPVRFLGPVADEALPGLVAAADVLAVPCRSRWGGLEQEGFGIVFLEAAACGVPQVAGDSGGAAEAVVDGETGIVVRHPRSTAEVADALRRLLDDPDLRTGMGRAARARAERHFDYDGLATRLSAALVA
ncbi:MAG TPA: glycosyltransferase [Acidimicrobiales bacterium]|nr:glycosyltransferase [Acidimicrobiales bacterium]